MVDFEGDLSCKCEIDGEWLTVTLSLPKEQALAIIQKVLPALEEPRKGRPLRLVEERR